MEFRFFFDFILTAPSPNKLSVLHYIFYGFVHSSMCKSGYVIMKAKWKNKLFCAFSNLCWCKLSFKILLLVQTRIQSQVKAKGKKKIIVVYF